VSVRLLGVDEVGMTCTCAVPRPDDLQLAWSGEGAAELGAGVSAYDEVGVGGCSEEAQ